ncbi:diguanylate cyclase [Alkalimarinus sediminis]|uniref:diguanylate cyclase n=1 Tax=Alkalimarinus sediminis TaxID=1632866 RepID=A0A9E8HUE5_9ALTE|nr:diguanylate cyclase [Alkalimarinus sediminis]UZW76721.1 diguanylate cyclase [Alkalimarinus sediminis]
MDRFTFPAKFFLISMLLAVPLSITSFQSVVDSNEQLRTAHIKHLGALNVHAFLPVIEALETMRDLSVAERFHRSEVVEAKYLEAKQQAMLEIEKFINNDLDENNQLISLNTFALQRAVETLKLTSGSEADLERTIFDKVNLLVSAAYSIQYQIANVNGLLGDIDPLANHLVIILTAELQQSFEAMGEARAYGSYFIANQILSSYGVELINGALSKLKDSELHLSDRFTILLSSHPKANGTLAIDSSAINRLNDIYMQVDDQILLDPDLTTTFEVFWQQSSDSIKAFNQFRRQIVLFLAKYYEAKERVMESNKNSYVFGVSALICVFIYLFIGFYLGIKGSLGELSKAAVQVAKGSLDKPITISSHDELKTLAALLDEMRVQLKDREQQLLDMTVTDTLTGVKNRKYFNEQLKECMALCRKTDQPTSLLMMDIDHFKCVNDTYGHTVGDKCLQLVAKTLQDNLSRPGDVVARYGGEEFAVLLPATDEIGAITIAERLCRSIRELSLNIEENEIDIRISIGISTSNLIPNCLEERLVNLADEALYKAKKTGRDRWISAHE